MRKRTIVTLLATLWMSLTSMQTLFAQSSYRDAIKAYAESSSEISMTFGKEKIQNALTALAKQARPDFTETQTAESVSRFVQDSLMNMVYDWMEGSFKGVVSEEDLKKAIAFNLSPEGKTAMEHSDVYHDEGTKTYITKSVAGEFLKIAMGEKPKDIKVEAPKNYQKLFHEYFALSDMGASVKGVLQQAFSANMNNGGGMSQEYVDGLMSYLDTNLETVMMNVGYKTVTEKDLNALISFYKTESGKNIVQASKTMANGVISFAQNLVMKYMQMIQK